uniref:Uncharacterized protein n=2 Tax=Pseudictyota dubia TaxID=2749911 RepID=A0A7R9W470_9STRA|mmetsp:Transcript_33063/g.60944  ORF Transcript_33063/g.60944 Transcript_33063/m.60944 type:complete len:162 (+) Transcript_33063:155-640(+)
MSSVSSMVAAATRRAAARALTRTRPSPNQSATTTRIEHSTSTFPATAASASLSSDSSSYENDELYQSSLEGTVERLLQMQSLYQENSSTFESVVRSYVGSGEDSYGNNDTESSSRLAEAFVARDSNESERRTANRTMEPVVAFIDLRGLNNGGAEQVSASL